MRSEAERFAGRIFLRGRCGLCRFEGKPNGKLFKVQLGCSPDYITAQLRLRGA